MPRKRSTLDRPLGSLMGAVAAHAALGDAGATELVEAEHAEREAELETRRGKRRAQPRDKGGKFA